ncbi:hypothetical protein JNUCC0626_05835 [Lentzea sp. JNUCC 0626]|uniref:hypothetical protein n=1 Tax=Lentzea sp. JNUCC 0626 TaxID=3367513 RepID=UPI0037499BF5
MITPTAYHDGAIRTPGGASFPVADQPRNRAVSPDLTQAVYATDNELVCIDQAGVVRWRYAFGMFQEKVLGAWAGCEFSLDGATVWLFRPDAMGHWNDCQDTWLVLDAATGTLLAGAELGTVGHAGVQHPHPNGTDVLVDVGEGQDGLFLFRGRLTGDTLEVVPYPWNDRALLDFSPDGHHFMTVDHQQEDVAFHTYPGGEVVHRVSVVDLGFERDAAWLAFTGGYLDADTAFAATTDEDEEQVRHHLIDVHTGTHLGTFDAHTGGDAYGAIPVGGGAWLTIEDGVFHRHTR